MNTDVIESAIRLAGMGFGVIPVNPTNKVSIIRWKIDGPLRDAATITEFWNKNPNAKVAVTPPPGYEFVDLDRKNGKDGLAALAAKGYEWPEGGWRYYTESGGEHALFKLPDGIKGPTDASVVADGVDRRGAGTGYVVCHALYGCAWISQQAPLPAPAWVYAGCGPIGRAVELHDIKRPVGMTDIQLQDLCTRAVAHAARFNDRDAWRDLGFALHHETGGSAYGLQLFDYLSALPAARTPNESGGRDKYSDRACEQLWRSASDDDRPGGTVTIRSLIDIVGASDIARQVASQDRIEEKHGEVVRDVPVETPVLSSAYTPSDLAHKWGAEGMLMNKSLKWPAQLDYVIHALGTAGWGHRYGYDTFRNEIMYCDWSGPNEGQWRPFIDVMYTQCMLDLIHVGFDPALKYDMVRRAVQFVADRFKFDSAQVWLDSLEWDGIPRIAKFMTAYCGATDDAYSDAVSRYMWSGAAGRIIDPGHKCDMIPVFVTPNVQGVKKSHGIEALSPDRDHYVTIDLSVRDAELSRKLRGKLFVELAELAGMRKRQLEAVKSWITLRDDVWRPNYQEFTVRAPRRFIAIGTTNEDEFLEDTTGNRRWLPIHIDGVDIEQVERDRLQLWAEGANLFRSKVGVKPANQVDWRDAESLAENVHREHMVHDDMEPLVVAAVEKVTRPFQLGEVMFHMGMAQTTAGKPMEMRIAAILKTLGFVKKQRWANGKNSKAWG